MTGWALGGPEALGCAGWGCRQISLNNLLQINFLCVHVQIFRPHC